jgi:hypothetical protein
MAHQVRKELHPTFVFLCCSLFAYGCSDASDEDGGRGDLSVLLQAEETITEGLEPGEGDENVVDGWSVHFEKYIVGVGDVRIGSDADHISAESAQRSVVDLTEVAPGGSRFTELTDVRSEQYDFFGYSLLPASVAERDSSVSEEDFDELVEAGASHLIEGTLEKSDGQSCPPGEACRDAASLTFRFLVPLEVTLGPCEIDATQRGVAVTENGTSSVGITLHGDHMFFNAFPTGAEGIVERRAQWLADADVNGDDHIDSAELDGIGGPDLSDLLPSSVYDLGVGAPFPLESAADFLRAQLATQGHYQGEGECEWTIAQ